MTTMRNPLEKEGSATGIVSKFKLVQYKIDLELELEPHHFKKLLKSKFGAGSTSLYTGFAGFVPS